MEFLGRIFPLNVMIAGLALPSTNVARVRFSQLGVLRGFSCLVLYSALRGFSPGTAVFPSHQKPTFGLT